MNRREVTYYDVSPFAAQSAQAVPSNNLQPFSDVRNLFAEGLEFRSIQTCEHNYTVLDGTHDAFARGEVIALWSSQQSAYPDRTLPAEVTLNVVFGGLQSSDGISFAFDTQNNVFADEVRVQWYKDGALLSDATFNPNSPAYSFNNAVEYYNRVFITFTRMNMPYRFLKIEAVYFGLVRVFGDGELENLTINEGLDLTGQSIYINSLSFAVNTHDQIPYLFRKRQPLVVRYNGAEMGRYYIDKSTRHANRRFDVEAVDKIGVLDNTDEFLGGIYKNVYASTVINDIVNGLFPVTIDPSLQNAPITGWIPILKRRDALALVALAIGAIIDATRTDEIHVKPLPTELSEVIAPERVYRASSVNIEFPYTSVEVVEHNYVAGGASKDLVKDTFTGTKTYKFSEPIYNLYFDQTAPASVGTLVDYGANYAIINSPGTGETRLKGYSYLDNQNSVTVSTPQLIQGTEERTIKIDKGTLINPGNSQAIAQRLYEYYQRQEVFDGDFVASFPNTEKIGDIVEVPTVFDDDDIVGQIEKLTLNLGWENIKARGVIRGN